MNFDEFPEKMNLRREGEVKRKRENTFILFNENKLCTNVKSELLVKLKSLLE